MDPPLKGGGGGAGVQKVVWANYPKTNPLGGGYDGNMMNLGTFIQASGQHGQLMRAQAN